jgi:Lrp/AsnC family transcriptional regulator for asnA, asnC and gidA
VGKLQENGRQSNVSIARALGLTEATIRNRIERLLSSGFIRITAVIDPRRTAYQIDAIIWMRVRRDEALQVAQWLAALPNVAYVAHTTGRYDLIIEALFESDDDLFGFLMLATAHGVQSTQTCHVLRTVKINYDWSLPVDGGEPRDDGRGSHGLENAQTTDRRRIRARRATAARAASADGAENDRK